ncbi:hypothetical protein HMPREF9466_01446 [Fusobacterium necrophorum subsp. funduliforme 1_1_36S]|nr:hypothetical protein HMPREF9466_01446 [Fusobacterium necrophorum subsp. funduliforme 1_1_36S]
MIKFNDVEYHLYEVRGYDHFLCEDLKNSLGLTELNLNFVKTK